MVSEPTGVAQIICGTGSKSNPGFLCTNPAGKNTTHEGSGPCWIHETGIAEKFTRYSGLVTREAIADLLEKFAQDPDPLNVAGELIMVRSLLTDYINRYQENNEAVLAWHASWNGRPWRTEHLILLREVLAEFEAEWRDQVGEPEEDDPAWDRLRRAQGMVEAMEVAYSGRPREVLDISSAYRLAAEATKIVERIEKMRNRGAVSAEEFSRVMTEIGRMSETAISPSRIRLALQEAGVDVSNIPELALMRVADTLRNKQADLWMTIRIR